MRITYFSMIVILLITSLPLLATFTKGKLFRHDGWELSFSLGASPLFLASIVNFSRFYPLSTLNLLSA